MARERKEPKKIAGARKRGDWWHLDRKIDGVRYREPLNTKDWREVGDRIAARIAEIKAGKVASPAGKAFARLPLNQAVEVFKNERIGKVGERTSELDRDRSKPLVRYFKDKAVRTFKPEDVVAYQQWRIAELAASKKRTVAEAIANNSGRTVNMETGILHQIIKKAKMFNVLADWPQPFPEHEREIGKALEPEMKLHLFRVAASRPEWLVSYCAAVLAVYTAGRKVEVRHVQWKHVDLFAGELRFARSKTTAGVRRIPLHEEAKAALARLRERAELAGAVQPNHYVFPACENQHLDPTKPQQSFRTAWRSLVDEAARQAGQQAAARALAHTHRLSAAKAAWREASAPYSESNGSVRSRFRMHDLRHQCVTEMAENGESDAAIESIAGHMSARMREHYSHVRWAAKQKAIHNLPGGLINPVPAPGTTPESKAIN